MSINIYPNTGTLVDASFTLDFNNTRCIKSHQIVKSVNKHTTPMIAELQTVLG